MLVSRWVWHLYEHVYMYYFIVEYNDECDQY